MVSPQAFRSVQFESMPHILGEDSEGSISSSMSVPAATHIDCTDIDSISHDSTTDNTDSISNHSVDVSHDAISRDSTDVATDFLSCDLPGSLTGFQGLQAAYDRVIVSWEKVLHKLQQVNDFVQY